MWRSVFLAIGVSFCILGLECLVVDEAVLAHGTVVSASAVALSPSTTGSDPRQFKTEEWMPWSFLATGAVIILYSINLPKRFKSSP